MKLVVKDTTEILSFHISELIVKKIHKSDKKNFVLGLPTGETPLPIYQCLINYYKQGKVSFKNVITYNMDEYLGLPPDHPQSYAFFMKENFFKHIDIPKKNINLLDGLTNNWKKTCLQYEDSIKALGGIDFFLGGLGTNGHIAFNEPGSSFDSRTRKVNLTNQTLKDNSRFFLNKKEQAHSALTIGIATLLEAKELCIVATGKRKSVIVKKLLDSKVNKSLPVSILKIHSKAILYCDKEATSLI